VLAERAAWLAKADLVTSMVGEFPQLQGIMGRYYALSDGEPPLVAIAIEQHYRPRFAGDALPANEVALALALADKLETLAGMFGVGQHPSGDKDPFALRRHALGVIRILIEGRLELPLFDLVNEAFSVFPRGMVGDARTDLEIFVFERLRSYLREAGYSANEIESVLCMHPTRLDQVPRRLAAVRAFAGLPDAASLAAANKRVANILKQAEAKGESFNTAQAHEMKEPAERDLFDALKKVSRKATPLFQAGDYTGYLKAFAVLRSPVDAFFESVMVMVDDQEVRKNRLALLRDLRDAMNRVADISKLAA
jgi:glycyl-tRNA synthetase beta chain